MASDSILTRHSPGASRSAGMTSKSECMSFSSRGAVLAGIGLMLLSVTLFSLNDAIGKWLVGAYPVGEALLIRSVVALALIAPFVWREGLSAFTAAPRPRLQILRAVISTTEVVCFFWSVGYLPLADVITFYLAGPIYVTALAPFVLNEHVGWRRGRRFEREEHAGRGADGAGA